MDRKSLESKTSEAQLTFLLQILMIDVCGETAFVSMSEKRVVVRL